MPVTINGTTGIAGVDGSASTPAVQGSDTNTGEFFPAADTIAWTTGGSERMRVDSSGSVGIGTSSPSYKLDVNGITSTSYLNLNTNTSTAPSVDAAVTRPANGTLAFISNAAERMRIDSSGRVGIGTTGPTATLEVSGSLYHNGNWAQVGNYNSGGTYPSLNNVSCGIAWNFSSGGREIALMNCDTGPSGTGGGFRMYQRTSTSTNTQILYVPGNGVTNNTTASAANVYVDGSNLLHRSTSSLKYKTDVKDATHGLAEVMQLRPVTYKGKNDGDKVFGGLIAEEVDAVGLTEFVQYAEDGSPDALAYGNMVSLLVKAIQELSAKVDAQAAEIAALKANAPA